MLKYTILNLDLEIVSLVTGSVEKIPKLQLLVNNIEASNIKPLSNNQKEPIVIFTNIETLRIVNACAPGSLNYYVVISAYANDAFEAMESGASDFMLSSFSLSRFKESINRLTQKFLSRSSLINNDYFFVRNEVRGKLIRINLNEIVFVESAHNYILIHTGDEVFTVYLSLTKMEFHLPREHFSRIHKSFIINDERIRSVERNQVILTCKTVVTLGQSYKEVFLNKLQRNTVLSAKNSAK